MAFASDDFEFRFKNLIGRFWPYLLMDKTKKSIFSLWKDPFVQGGRRLIEKIKKLHDSISIVSSDPSTDRINRDT